MDRYRVGTAGVRLAVPGGPSLDQLQSGGGRGVVVGAQVESTGIELEAGYHQSRRA